jgi:hypothetical protein
MIIGGMKWWFRVTDNCWRWRTGWYWLTENLLYDIVVFIWYDIIDRDTIDITTVIEVMVLLKVMMMMTVTYWSDDDDDDDSI